MTDMSTDPYTATHELLLRFAGRLEDRLLWRFRDWLASGALDALARTMPLTLLRERVAITAHESLLLNAALLDAGADPGRLSAVPWVDEIGELDYTFTAESPDWVIMGDPTAVVLGAVLHGRSEVVDVRGSWRRGRVGDMRPRRIVLVTASSDCPRLAGELQRVLRALGTYEPGVEVMPEGIDLPPYHRAALAASEPMLPGLAMQGQLVPH